MVDLYIVCLENEKVKKQLVDVVVEFKLNVMKKDQDKIDILEYELRREVEDLKFCFQMVVDYYKEKFKEC